VDNTRHYARVSHSRQWSNYNSLNDLGWIFNRVTTKSVANVLLSQYIALLLVDLWTGTGVGQTDSRAVAGVMQCHCPKWGCIITKSKFISSISVLCTIDTVSSLFSSQLHLQRMLCSSYPSVISYDRISLVISECDNRVTATRYDS